MKSIFKLGKRWLRNSPGFTLTELVLALAVGSLVMSGVFAVWIQLFSVTSVNSNYMASFRQVQNGGDWISQDALMTQRVYDMASTELDGDINASQTTITVNSTFGFPSVGVICIEDELIQYTGIAYDDPQFTGCIRGHNATAHDDGGSVTVFATLSWTDWSGNQHQVVYNLREISRHLMRSYYVKAAGSTDFILQRSNTISEAIVLDETTSAWDYDEKKLTVVITANVGDYVVGRHGFQSQMATRTYTVHPRPFF